MMTMFTCAQKLANSQVNLPHGTKPNEERVMKKLKTKTEMLRTNCQYKNKVCGVSPGARRFVKVLGLEPGVKERELLMVRLVS